MVNWTEDNIKTKQAENTLVASLLNPNASHLMSIILHCPRVLGISGHLDRLTSCPNAKHVSHITLKIIVYSLLIYIEYDIPKAVLDFGGKPLCYMSLIFFIIINVTYYIFKIIFVLYMSINRITISRNMYQIDMNWYLHPHLVLKVYYVSFVMKMVVKDVELQTRVKATN